MPASAGRSGLGSAGESDGDSSDDEQQGFYNVSGSVNDSAQTPSSAPSTDEASSQARRRRAQPHVGLQSFLARGDILAGLYAGCHFRGVQESDDRAFAVEVVIQKVDPANDYWCGDLTVHNLTPDRPFVRTFFDAEIIGERHSFFTKRWGATSRIDLAHWERFDGFADCFSRSRKDGRFVPAPTDPIFMRWKERFLVPEYDQTTVEGASFEGFYYMVYDRRRGLLSGFYFHHTSEPFQEIRLTQLHDMQRRDTEFR